MLPEGKALVPGVIDTVTNRVEHPRLLAQRLERFVNIVCNENVIAGNRFAVSAPWTTAGARYRR
jgi:5-methyltetrahydropteroyltriglutamate--homocysteine methyltransferase